MGLGLPTISIAFQAAAQTAVARGERGVVAILARDAENEGVYSMRSPLDAPAWVKSNATMLRYVEDAFKGNIAPPRKVVLVVAPSTEADIALNLARLYSVAYNYGVCAFSLSSADITALAAWVAEQRAAGRKIKFVVPNAADTVDSEGIVNLAMTSITVGSTAYTSDEMCARIAGLLAGTPLTMSATYSALRDVSAVSAVADLDAAIGDGQFVLFHDGEKVKVARAVNTFRTYVPGKGEEWSKIKIVDILDLMATDVRRALEDTYIGKYSNSYDNKLLVVLAFNSYLESLVTDGLLDSRGVNSVEIDVEAQRAYLASIGADVDSMSEREILEANTGDNLFLLMRARPLDAIEDVTVKVLL